MRGPVDIYSFYERQRSAHVTLQKRLEVVNQPNSVQNLVIKDYQQVQGKRLVCISVWMCESLSQYGGLLSHDPRVLQGCKKKKKSLIQNHPGGLLLQRESLAGFANRSPPKLNKQKTSTASRLFLQHGSLCYETWQWGGADTRADRCD